MSRSEHNPSPPAMDPTTLDPSMEAGEPVVDGLVVAGRARPPRRTPKDGIGLTPDGRLKSGRLAGLSMPAAIWVLSWPIMAESFLNSMVGLTDTVLAAQLPDGESATDAIGGASYMMWFVGLIAMAIGVGATALISRAVGAGRMAVANAATAQTMLLAISGGVISAVLLAVVAPHGTDLLNFSPSAAAAFVEYLRIVAWGVPALTILAAGIACARGAGDSKRPLIAMVLVNVVNIAASWTLTGVDYRVTDSDGISRVLLSNPSPLDWGISGIAWGTVLAEWVGAAVVLLMLARGWSGVRLPRHRLRPHWHTLKRLIRVGIPNFLETLGMWFGNMFVLLFVGWLVVDGISSAGPDPADAQLTANRGLLGCHIVAIRIEAFSFLPGFAMGTAAATLAGQFLGAGSVRLATRAILVCTAVTVVMMGVTGAAFCMAPHSITGLVTSQPAHLHVVPQLLFICGLVQIPFGIGIILRSALRGAGDVKAVMWLTWITTYAVRLPLAYAMSGVDIPVPSWAWTTADGSPAMIDHPFLDEPSLAWLWIGLCIEIVIRCLLFVWRFMQGRWTTARV